MCQSGANRNTWAVYRMSSSRSPLTQTEWSQIGDNRLTTSCGFVERPDHHCGDNLVLVVMATGLDETAYVNRDILLDYDAVINEFGKFNRRLSLV